MSTRALAKRHRRPIVKQIQRFLKRATGRTIAVTTVFVSLAFSVLNVLGLRPPATPQKPVLQLAELSRDLEVIAPKSALPRSPIRVRVAGTQVPDGTTVRLDVQTALMTARYAADFAAGSASFNVDPDLVEGSGTLVLTASTERNIGQATVVVEPGSARDGVIPLAGPRSIVADTQHWTMVSVIPGDIAGNGLADGTPVRLHVRRPDGAVERVDGVIENLLDGIRVYSGTVSGLTTIRVEVMGATGPEIQVREVAGPPVAFALEAEEGALVADGRSLVEVRTPQLRDQYGNVVEDGTAVEVRGTAPDGPFRIVSSTIDGRAIIRLRSPGEPGAVTMFAEVAGTLSETLNLAFALDALEFDVRTVRRGADVDVTIGPVRSSLGGFAPDGTPVVLTIEGQNDRQLQLYRGVASATVEAASGEPVTVKILGRSVDATAP